MSRPSRTIVSVNGIATSLAASGIPALAETGTLRYIGNPVHDAEITIIGDGVIDFGQKYAYLIQAIKLDSSVGGVDFEITSDTMENGQQVYHCAYASAEKLPLHSVAGMPYGVGIAIGDKRASKGDSPLWGHIRTRTSQTYDVVFKYEIGLYPAANQANCITYAVPGQNEQIKGSWDLYYVGGANSNYVDVYTGVFAPKDTNFQEPALAIGNNGYIGSVIYPVVGEYEAQLLDPTHYRSALHMRSSSLKFSKTDGRVHSRMVVDGYKTLHNYGVDVDLTTNTTQPHPESHHFPANIQGIDIADGQQYYIGERVILGRSAARVEICDTPLPQIDWEAVTGLTKRYAVSLPVAWSSKVLKVRLREQVFAGESLNGKYLHVYKHADSNVEGIFIGAILIDGEKLV